MGKIWKEVMSTSQYVNIWKLHFIKSSIFLCMSTMREAKICSDTNIQLRLFGKFSFCFRSRVKMPPVILAAYEKGAVLNNRHPALSTMTQRELAELLQWSDMIVLDYITGHYDRWDTMVQSIICKWKTSNERKSRVQSSFLTVHSQYILVIQFWMLDKKCFVLTLETKHRDQIVMLLTRPTEINCSVEWKCVNQLVFWHSSS